MSEVKIQTSSPNDLAGGQAPLTAEGEQKQRSGFSGRQNQMSDSIGRGVQVDITNRQNAPVSANAANGAGARDAASVKGLSVAGRDVAVKHVDQRCIEGSYAGDTRKQGVPAVLPNMPGPRQGMGQARLTNKLDTPPVTSFPAGEVHGG